MTKFNDVKLLKPTHIKYLITHKTETETVYKKIAQLK